jgi:hypothetical protein
MTDANRGICLIYIVKYLHGISERTHRALTVFHSIFLPYKSLFRHVTNTELCLYPVSLLKTLVVRIDYYFNSMLLIIVKNVSFFFLKTAEIYFPLLC